MIYTVTGAIKKEALGMTLSHEHIAWDGGDDNEQMYFDRIYDEDKTEAMFKLLSPLFGKLSEAGCRSVVEASPPEGWQNLKLMQKLSKASGVSLIANTGMIFSKNVFRVHRELFDTELAERWISDFENGLDSVNGIVIKPAFIKIFMSKGKLPEVDKNILKAAIIASKATGMPVHCHIMEAATAEEVMELLDGERFDMSKFLWAHACNEGNLGVIEKAAAKGMWLGFDMIKRGTYDKHLSLIREAIAKGYENKILLSQDYDFYEETKAWPGDNPCISLFSEFVPHCIENGISREVLSGILIQNPADYLDMK